MAKTGIFRFATNMDILFIVVGVLGSLANGASFPIMMVVFTSIIDTFINNQKEQFINALTNTTTADPNKVLTSSMKDQAIYLVIIGISTMFVSYFQVSFWLMPAERQTRQIRKNLFRSILRQEIGWFDTYKSGELTSRLTDDITKVKDGIGDKFGSAIQFVSTFITGIIIGFVRGWKLTLVILSLSPLLFGCAVVFTKLAGYLTTNELKSYAKAGAIAEEAITAIRTVFSFNGSNKEHKRYEKELEAARKFGIKKGVINGVLMGVIWLVINSAYSLGFWYGWTLTKIDPTTGESEYTIGKILLVFFSIIMAIFSLGNAAPFIGTLATARAAAYEVFKIIDRIPKIDTESSQGLVPKELVGNIEFNNVSFNYPARPEIQILKNMSFKVKSGSTVAFVGSSGCGKSTCIQLLQRFYDPDNGSVIIDGIDAKNYNVNWLRTHIGVVSQEPILFDTTIAENIKMGRDNVTQEEIEEAAKNANAHDFIMTLPDKYETLVGNRGSQLSGGQKQRVAIARALVRNPKILLLDEATSALDNESEAIVQAALDRASLGRTTAIVAHRLSTIRNADVIFAMEKGQIVEFGTHDELMERKNLYYSLVVTQQTGTKDDNKSNKVELKARKSINEDKKKEEAEETNNTKKVEKEKTKDVPISRVLALNKPEIIFIILGCLASLVTGGVQPAFSIIFTYVIDVFAKPFDEQGSYITLYCSLFIGLGVISMLSNLIQSSMFSVSGENLTKRLRSKGFQAMLTQEIGWFDEPDNNVGVLTTRLAVEAAAVQGAGGVRIGFVLMNLGNFGVGLTLAFIYGWPITLLILGFIPFMIMSGVLQTKMLTGFSGKDKEVLEEAGKITNQAISNIRTVALLNKEKYFYDKYSAKIEIPYKSAMKSANTYGFMFGFTNSIMFYATAAAFSLGAYLVAEKKFGITFKDINLVFSCVIFGAQSVGQASSFMPDYTKAKIAVNKMFELFDRKPKINNWTSESNTKIDEKDFNGQINFNSVSFRYPTRPDVTVLDNFSINIDKGQRIALVGSSGCGKSTVTQLLERFYDAEDGEITVSNQDIKALDLFWLRSQIGIVSQEPILFDMSIAENIAYGDNSREVPMDEIIEAAKQANIHNFIASLPQGYNTNVGSKGTQLSGGQKQRIAIARALVRNPKILLLDEATSALDIESEKVVQEALDKAQIGRTCIVIAHRLSTIKDADVIYVIKEGKILEKGNHEDLMNMKGFYWKLNSQH